jgi:hypothetical protein
MLKKQRKISYKRILLKGHNILNKDYLGDAGEVVIVIIYFKRWLVQCTIFKNAQGTLWTN